MRLFERFAAIFSQAFGVVATISVVSIMVALTSEAVSRILTGSSLPGVFELVETLVIVVAFMGLAYTERSGKSVRVTLLTNRLTPNVTKIVTSVAMFAAALTALWIAYASWGNAFQSLDQGEFRPGLVEFPLWPARFIAALGITMAAVEFFATGLRSLRGVDKQAQAETSKIGDKVGADASSKADVPSEGSAR